MPKKTTKHAEPKSMPHSGAMPPDATPCETSVPPALHSAPDCPIVGIGASAGGLAAFEAFFRHMPAETDRGIAFVLVQHLAHDHTSLLSELVQRYTHMRVSAIEERYARRA